MRSNRSLASLAVMILLATSAAEAQTSKPADGPSSGPASRPAVKSGPILEQVIPELTAEKEPLEKVISRLRDQTGAKIFVNWVALEKAGVKKDAPVTAKLRDVKLGAVLSVVLAEAAKPQQNALAYKLDKSVIVISTKAELNANQPGPRTGPRN